MRGESQAYKGRVRKPYEPSEAYAPIGPSIGRGTDVDILREQKDLMQGASAQRYDVIKNG